MAWIYLSLGSNFGDREKNIEEAVRWLENRLKDIQRSANYETPEINGYGPPYYNSVIKGETDLSFDNLNSLLKDYEIKCGRTSEAKKRKEVIIDIDIVIWDKKIIREKDYFCNFFQIGFQQICTK